MELFFWCLISLTSICRLGRSVFQRLLSLVIQCTFWFISAHIDLGRQERHANFSFSFQTMLKSAGCQMKPTVFLLTDTQIKEESFLEDVDSLLNTGEVPNLFAVDEKAELIEVTDFFYCDIIISCYL